MRLSVRPCVVAISLDHFFDPKIYNIALKEAFWVLKLCKMKCPPRDTKCNLISMEIKVNKKNEHPGWEDQDLNLFVGTFDMTSVTPRF